MTSIGLPYIYQINKHNIKLRCCKIDILTFLDLNIEMLCSITNYNNRTILALKELMSKYLKIDMVSKNIKTHGHGIGLE